ncbi:YdeI/OmpD-associated family protein [Altibacter sp.]|uniref:YdeI/OmpD-associated family protein n=1 Tax=Altibacter sp. TaxID=2024823 RepID=UPI00258CCBB7|nr:YdeI/OmpD-associated family protein [Altibacter sp.]MCW9037155.1 YdeI/OmpD-associated family protein [Altibacter sp.]
MTDSEKIDRYIETHEKWTDKLEELREIFQQTELKETVKWGTPTYTLNGKLVAGMAAFKNHYAIWFHQGVFLKDTHQKLVNAQEGVTKALRQWRFEAGDTIERHIVLQYLQEAIKNCIDGKEVKIERKKGVVLPPLLKEALKHNNELKEAFHALTPGKQREYAAYIGDAKQQKTKESRLEKIEPMILKGVGLHDKYKNC